MSGWPALVRAAARGRDHHRHRLAALGADRRYRRAARQFLDNRPAPEVIAGTAVGEAKLAFVFSGNGAQFAGMGREALRASRGLPRRGRDVDARVPPGARLVGRPNSSPAASTPTGWRAPTLPSRCCSRSRSASSKRCARLGVAASRLSRAQRRRDRRGLGRRRADPGRCRARHRRAQPHQQRTRGIGRMAALALDGDAARSFLAELGSPAEIAAFNAAHSVTRFGSGRGNRSPRQRGAPPRHLVSRP